MVKQKNPVLVFVFSQPLCLSERKGEKGRLWWGGSNSGDAIKRSTYTFDLKNCLGPLHIFTFGSHSRRYTCQNIHDVVQVLRYCRR